MKTITSKQFHALFALHAIIACILPFLSVVLGPDVPIYWWDSCLIFIIAIPWEGYIFMVPNPKSNLSKVSLNSMHFRITLDVLFWAVCAYGVWESHWFNFKYMYWYTVFAASCTTYRHRMLLMKYIEQFKLSGE